MKFPCPPRFQSVAKRLKKQVTKGPAEVVVADAGSQTLILILCLSAGGVGWMDARTLFLDPVSRSYEPPPPPPPVTVGKRRSIEFPSTQTPPTPSPPPKKRSDRRKHRLVRPPFFTTPRKASPGLYIHYRVLLVGRSYLSCSSTFGVSQLLRYRQVSWASALYLQTQLNRSQIPSRR